MSSSGIFVVLTLILFGTTIWFYLGWRNQQKLTNRVLDQAWRDDRLAHRLRDQLTFTGEADFKLWPRKHLDALTNDHLALHRVRTNAILRGRTRKEGTT